MHLYRLRGLIGKSYMLVTFHSLLVAAGSLKSLPTGRELSVRVPRSQSTTAFHIAIDFC
jgi:hypothetical protein